MNILTFDIEEWFHVLDHPLTRSTDRWPQFESRIENNVDRILQLLDDFDQRATFFCLGWVAREYPRVVRHIADTGHDIGSHSDIHQLAYEQSPTDFANDLRKSLSVIEDAIGKPVRAYRAPGFSLTSSNTWVLEELLSAGICIDSSIFPAARAHGGFEGFSEAVPAIIRCRGGEIREFPMNTANLLGKAFVFSGGGYFRLLPYALIARLTRSSRYVMTYFHPRDFDPGQPLMPGLSAYRHFKSYYGLSGAEKKLRGFLTDFDFVDLASADAATDWSSVPVFELDQLG